MQRPSPTRRLVAFLLGLAALAGGAEALVRLHLDLFEAAAHRARFKAALLARQGPLRFAAIGTSRLNDGVSPADVTRVLEAHGQQGRGFNASVPSSALATQAFLAGRALEHPGLEALFLEVSPHQLAALTDETLEERAAPPAGFEERALAASALVRNRRVLMVENLPRLAALAFASRYDGSEFFRTRWLTESLAEGARPPPLPPPEVLCPGAGDAPPAGEHEAALQAWTAMARAARAKGVRVYFVAPPLVAADRAGECGEPWAGLWRALAARSGAPVLSWACAAAPDALFTDGHHHLGAAGRAAFSDALGLAWVAAPACEAPR